MNRPDPAQLAATVENLSDDELAKQISELGTDGVLAGIFSGMEEAFQPEAAAGVSSTIQYDIKSDEGVNQWMVEVSDGACSTSPGPADSPRLTLQLDLVDFVRLIFGQAEGPQLFMSGKLKLQGDMMFAMQMQKFFRRDF
jgi:putative sterol carrier protein